MRKQGTARLEVEAGRAFSPGADEFVDVGLPFGPKPRLILVYLNAEALRTGSPEIEVEDSLTAFVKRLGLVSKGRNMLIIKDQLARLSAAEIRLAVAYGTAQSPAGAGPHRHWLRSLVSEGRAAARSMAFDRALFPSTTSRACNATPCPWTSGRLPRCPHSAMALDIYAWLAQRLHRINPGKPAFIPWTALKEQFGWHYGRMDNFKRVFRQTLTMVLSQYRGARLELDDRGMALRNSPPPVQGPDGPDLQGLRTPLPVGKA